jgi:hypothetical protein
MPFGNSLLRKQTDQSPLPWWERVRGHTMITPSLILPLDGGGEYLIIFIV